MRDGKRGIFGCMACVLLAACSDSGGEGKDNPTCALNDWVVSGSIDGAAQDGMFRGRGAASGASFGPWQQRVNFVDGLLAAWGTAESEYDKPVTGKALLSAPPSSFLAGAQIFADTASMTYGDALAPVHFEGLHRVGACPGGTGSGSIDVCVAMDISATCPVEFSGSFDGTALSASVGGHQGASQSDGTSSYELFLIELDPDGYIMIQGSPTIADAFSSAIVLMPSSGTEAGAVYCVTNVTQTSQAGTNSFKLDGLARAGHVPGEPVSGSLDLSYCPYY